jgi:predicted dehydrogenase/nucleoside-diphosphate-sugar epimerase
MMNIISSGNGSAFCQGQMHTIERVRSGPLRVAVVGCGAVSQTYHIPVLAGHEQVRLVALIDRNMEVANRLARAYGIAVTAADLDALEGGSVDAALIATPPHHHATAAISLLRRGIHVLVEKPMALNSQDAAAMVQVAEETGAVLAVGHFRRLFPSSRLLAALLATNEFGRPITFDVEEGHIFDWPLVTLGSMRKDLAGGGVLIDTGSHTLDQLLSFFFGHSQLLEYRDNSLGGIEADCLLHLRLFHHGQPIEGRVELSRTRKLRNTFRIICERATLELPLGERYRVTITPGNAQLEDPVRNTGRPYNLQAGWLETPEPGSHQAFREEIEDWLTAIRLGQHPVLSGASVLPTVQLIEECYRSARPLVERWVREGFRTGNSLVEKEKVSAGEEAAQSLPAIPKRERPQRILITGATGFIGCRVAELLRYREGYEVRALVHNPGSASRLARLSVEMVMGDLRSPSDMAQAVQGCDAIVHCAYGTSWGQRREMFAVTVDGTRNLAEVARAAGLRRFVHLSTIAVHGKDLQGILDESTPVRPPHKDDYAWSKAQAEQVIERASRRGLSAVTLRLACVYGPYSRAYTIRPVEHLLQGMPVLVGRGDTPSNMVYVDSVADAIIRALQASREVVDGQIFTIGDDEGVTWASYHGWYARALGVEMRAVPVEEFERMRASQKDSGLGKWMASWYRGLKTITTSEELLGLGKKILQTDPFGRLPRGILNRFPAPKERIRHLLGLDRPFIYRPAEGNLLPHPPLELLELYAFPARVSSTKARRVLGYSPVPHAQAMEWTLEWLHHAGYLARPVTFDELQDTAPVSEGCLDLPLPVAAKADQAPVK